MRRCLFALIAVSLLLNIILIAYVLSDQSIAMDPVAEQRESYQYLSPRIFVENRNDTIINFIPLRNRIQDLLAKTQTPIGYYFEYLPSGISIGVNEKESFVPASLLKVPLVMAALKQVELKHMSAEQTLTVTDKDLDPFFGELWKQGKGTTLTLEQTIEKTLKESDNTAKNLLIHALPDGALDEVFDYLDIPKELEGNLAVVSPKNYSSILRSLYLSSYLDKEYSNHILSLLTKTAFTDRIVAGVPSGVPVAHKIGVYAPKQEGETHTDCGIVYVPKRPYILCVMVKGSQTEADTLMRELSRLTYDYVAAVNLSRK